MTSVVSDLSIQPLATALAAIPLAQRQQEVAARPLGQQPKRIALRDGVDREVDQPDEVPAVSDHDRKDRDGHPKRHPPHASDTPEEHGAPEGCCDHIDVQA